MQIITRNIMGYNIKLVNTFLLLGVLLLGVGCDVSEEPIGRVTPDQIDQEPTASTITSSVNSSYRLLSQTLNIIDQWNWAEGKVTRNDFILHDIASGDLNKKWQPDGDQAWMDRAGNFNFTPTNQAFQGIWTYDYEGISRTNRAIDDLTSEEIVSQIDLEQNVKDRLLGEAYFLRAYYYFDLVNNFGDVPLLLEPLQNFDSAFERTTRVDESKVWDQIRNDLSKAVSLLPDRKFSSSEEPWRASVGAAIAMQAKVALFNENWQTVIDKVNTLQGKGFYSLNDHYFDSFSFEQEYQEDEVIFAYDHRAGRTPSKGNGLGALTGWGFIAPTQDFLNEFEENDPRKKYTVNVEDKVVFKILGDTTDAFRGNADSPGNRIYLRWADVLLWKAEAHIETGSMTPAIRIINDIRERARNTPTLDGDMPPSGTLPARDVNETDKATVMDWLIHERRVELGFESHRFNDLKRWGMAEEVLTDMGKSYQEHNKLYPIPQSEIDKSGGEMKQNPGY